MANEEKEKVDVNAGPDQHDFADAVAEQTVKSGAETGEYRGIGGHGPEDHGGHGPHTQTSIGLGNKTVNIRKSTK